MSVVLASAAAAICGRRVWSEGLYRMSAVGCVPAIGFGSHAVTSSVPVPCGHKGGAGSVRQAKVSVCGRVGEARSWNKLVGEHVSLEEGISPVANPFGFEGGGASTGLQHPFAVKGFEPAHFFAMEWLCPICTYINPGGSLECDVCAQPFDATDGMPGVNRAVGDNPLQAEWSCGVCTFLNSANLLLCEMCGQGEKPVAGNLGATRSMGTFRPLRVPLAGQRTDVARVSTGDQAPEEDIEAVRSGAESADSQEHVDEGQASAQVSEGISLPVEPVAETPLVVSHKRQREDDEVDPPASNSLLRRLHEERMSRSRRAESHGSIRGENSMSSKEEQPKGSSAADAPQKPSPVAIMFYNVWFREDVELLGRMAAIGRLIEEHEPHVICFQEVTPNIYDIFQKSSWWKQYRSSVTPQLASSRPYFAMQLGRLPVHSFRRSPFSNSVMGRELCLADVEVGTGKNILVATTHLESPCPAPPSWNQMYSKERVQQASEALKSLKDVPNVVFGGDMNWNDKLDGEPPLPSGWSDAWLQLKPREPGLTYDSKSNPMLKGSRLQSRLDRVFYHLEDFDLESIEMIGSQPIPGLTFQKEQKVKKQSQMVTLPVLPSDHFGLLLKIRQRV